MPIQGGDVVAKNILAFGQRFTTEVDRDMEQVRDLMDVTVTKNMTLTDHSLSDLAAMGHPYARRAPQAIHSPGYMVHRQSGALEASKYSGTDKASILGGKLLAKAFIGVDPGRAAHARMVVFGTSKMVPRDFLLGSLGELKNAAFELLRRSLKGAVISFNGQKARV